MPVEDSESERQELTRLYDASRSTVKDELGAAYQYLSFYVGLVAAILGATLAGFLNLGEGDWRGLALLAGPVMTAVLGRLGYSTVSVFYRRYAEAWVSVENLGVLLGLHDPDRWLARPPPYPSTLDGGPFARPIHPAIRSIFDRGEVEGWKAEKVASEIYKASSTLRYALLTFVSYGVIGLALGGLILRRALS
jgi:hypothetical protein